MLERLEFGDLNAPDVLVWMAGAHERERLEETISLISVDVPFGALVFVVPDWNSCLSPWAADVGKTSFEGLASETLSALLSALSVDPSKRYYLGGYSLAGLFALWASCQTPVFTGVAGVSPSVWYPGFAEYFCSSDVLASRVYLSLGDRESRTRNPVMATVGDCINACYFHVASKGILEWNKGNHFTEPERRLAAGFSWLLKG